MTETVTTQHGVRLCVCYDPPPIPGWQSAAWHTYPENAPELGCSHGATKQEAIDNAEESYLVAIGEW